MPSPELQTELRIIAEFTARPGQAAVLRGHLLKMIAPSNAEAGCRQYELHEDRESADRFVFVERWVDQAAFDSHCKTPHLLQLGPSVGNLLASPVKLTKLKIIG